MDNASFALIFGFLCLIWASIEEPKADTTAKQMLILAMRLLGLAFAIFSGFFGG